MYSDRDVFRRDFVLLMVEVKCERLTLAVVVLDHDFERLSFGGKRVVIEGEMSRRDGFRDGHRSDLERINRSHVQTAITADQTKPGQEQDAYRPCRITDVRFHDSYGVRG